MPGVVISGPFTQIPGRYERGFIGIRNTRFIFIIELIATGISSALWQAPSNLRGLVGKGLDNGIGCSLNVAFNKLDDFLYIPVHCRIKNSFMLHMYIA